MLKGKVAVISGGASGIGRACALMFAKEGASVFAGDLKPDPKNDAEFRALGITEAHLDVRDEASVKALVDKASRATGAIDILVNAAGVVLVKQIADVAEAEWDKVLDTNLKGPFLLSKHCIPFMRQQGGSIVMISSNAGLLPRAHDPVYSTSKLALQGFMRSLALCESPNRIRVNAICPGPVSGTAIIEADLAKAPPGDRQETIMSFVRASPLCAANKRMVTPEEVAKAAMYLASPASMMVTGTSIAIDGGKSIGVPPKSKL